MPIDSLARFITLFSLRVEQKAFFINFNFEKYLSYERTNIQVVRKSLKHNVRLDHDS